MISQNAMQTLLKMQQGEVNEYEIYTRIAAYVKDAHNKTVLETIANEENKHAAIWFSYTQQDLKPQMFKVHLRVLMARVFGFTFAAKLLEGGEKNAQQTYASLIEEIPEAEQVISDETHHEQAILEMLDEERLKYVGSMVLGLNDALVELTGTLAGLTLAMQNTRLIALSGLITGIAATLSMASSEYLSAKSEGRTDALKSCLYTGVAYLVTVAVLITPYLLFDPNHYLYALATMLGGVILVLVVFNFYISVAQGLSFKRRFGEMAAISLGVAALSFVVGIIAKIALGVDL